MGMPPHRPMEDVPPEACGRAWEDLQGEAILTSRDDVTNWREDLFRYLNEIPPTDIPQDPNDYSVSKVK